MLSKDKNRIAKWLGATVVCVASGPSLTQEDVESIRGKAKVIAVNREFVSAPWADACYAADYRFWKVYQDKLKEVAFSGEKWTMSVQARKEFGINCIGRSNIDGYSMIQDAISTGGNSGYQAVHLAAYWGASRIILLGYDMARTFNRDHHFGKHDGGLPNGRGFPFWVRRFVPLYKDLTAMGVKVINCSRHTALTCVPRKPLAEIVW